MLRDLWLWLVKVENNAILDGKICSYSLKLIHWTEWWCGHVTNEIDFNWFWFFLQIHVSISQLGDGAEAKKAQSAIGGSFVSLLLESVGVADTEVQDVEFKWVTFSSAINLFDNFVMISASSHLWFPIVTLCSPVKSVPFLLVPTIIPGSKWGLCFDCHDVLKEIREGKQLEPVLGSVSYNKDCRSKH